MWIWCSETGALLNAQRQCRQYGYAGRHTGLNNPSMQHVKGVGPLPEGIYRIEAPHDSETTGPYTLRLVPEPGTEMYGRSSFAIHGDRVGNKRDASHGCIVVGKAQRQEVWESADHRIRVIAI
jgi:hypothetical protein